MASRRVAEFIKWPDSSRISFLPYGGGEYQPDPNSPHGRVYSYIPSPDPRLAKPGEVGVPLRVQPYAIPPDARASVASTPDAVRAILWIEEPPTAKDVAFVQSQVFWTVIPTQNRSDER